MTTRKALGKGLGALLPDQGKMLPRVMDVPLNQIVRNRYQPRLNFDAESIKELAASIKENGVIQPVLLHKVEEGYELIAGERRYRAAKLLGMSAVPAIVKSIQRVEALELAIIENIQREDLNPVEQAKAFKMLMDEFSLTQEQVAKKVGKERSTVANFLRLLKLPEEIQRDLESGRLTMGHARALLACPSEIAMMEMRSRIFSLGLNVRDAEAQTRKKIRSSREKTPKNPFIRDTEESLQKRLSTKVVISGDKKGRGVIAVSYYSPEDLERLLEIFGRL
ncbi:MAG: ParB/RepB/Spo0J family partition protein [Nitrospinae bacterium]|nr:ParB/RepB/Spo0J family partition protein [Nitrospinota bacterium]